MLSTVGLIQARAPCTIAPGSLVRVRRESSTDTRLDGDEMAADADDGDAGHATGTYISSVVVGSGFQGNDLVRLDEEARRSLGGLDAIMESYLDDLNASVALIGRDDFTSNHAGAGGTPKMDRSLRPKRSLACQRRTSVALGHRRWMPRPNPVGARRGAT